MPTNAQTQSLLKKRAIIESFFPTPDPGKKGKEISAFKGSKGNRKTCTIFSNKKSSQSEAIKCLMMMNCFCVMTDRQKAFGFILSRDQSQRSSP